MKTAPQTSRQKAGRPPLYPWLDVDVGESFRVPVDSGPKLSSLRCMAFQTSRRHKGYRFRVSSVPVRGAWIVTRIAADAHT